MTNKTVEAVARAIYAVSPNGGMIRTPSTATNQFGHTVYDKVFEADSWEDAPNRHEKSEEEALAAIKAHNECSPDTAKLLKDNAELVKMLTDVNSDLESEIKGKFPKLPEDEVHPVTLRLYNRDMEIVEQARALLTRIQEDKT